MSSINDTAGLYMLRVKTGGSLICDMPVRVHWLRHPKEAEPFLGIKAADSDELHEALRIYLGKVVDLEFVPKAALQRHRSNEGASPRYE